MNVGTMLDTPRMDVRLGTYAEAVGFIGRWHSRLPECKGVAARVVFIAEVNGEMVGAALWGNTSARGLPQTWLELRRLAIRDDGLAPHCAASNMLGAMRRWVRVNMPEIERLVSYQDVQVHTGSIYRAAGWVPAYYSKPRLRSRSTGLAKRGKVYRSDGNGKEPAGAGKIRWEIHTRRGTTRPVALSQETLDHLVATTTIQVDPDYRREGVVALEQPRTLEQPPLPIIGEVSA